MPINRAGGWKGSGGVLAIPGRKFGASRSLAPTVSSKPFRSRSFSTYNATITGVTKDSAGVALAACTVQLFRTSDDSFRSGVVSDGAGNYTLYPDVTGPFYLVAYKSGSPDVGGTTVNTLLGA